MDAPPPADEIVILAPRLPEAPGEAAYSAYAIDEASLSKAIRLDQALRTAPGVSLFRRNDSGAANATTQGLSIRGFAPSGAGRALVTLDGAPQNDPFGGWVLWGALAPETIARANILRGAGAGPYGAGALTGVVQLEERRQQGATLSIEGGELGAWRAAGVGEARSDAFAFMLAASAQASDGWIPVQVGAGDADEALSFEAMSAVARGEWRGGGAVFSARLSGYADERSAGLADADSASDSTSLSLSLAKPDGPFSWRAQAWAIASDFANTSVALSLDRNVATPANRQVETPALGWGANAAWRWSSDGDGFEIGADLRTADGETREVFLFSGGQFTRSRVAGGRTLLAGIYGEAWRETGDWLLTGGVRADLYRAFDGARLERNLASGAMTLQASPEDHKSFAPTARLAARRQFGAWSLRGAVYGGFRPPTLNELHRPFRVGNDVTEANAALKPERIFGADLGVGGEYRDWSWGLGAFVNRLEDPIVNVTLGAGPGTFPPGVFVPAGGAYRQRQNAEAIDAFGFEGQARGQWLDALIWRAALSYTDAEAAGGLRPAQSPRWSATAGVDWSISPVTTLSADLSYESTRFEDDLNTRALAAATILDLRLEQRLSPSLALYAALDNALDSDIETAEAATGVESFGPPRALRIGMRIATR
jgi:outer membrane receptor protein involved in Fe transport